MAFGRRPWDAANIDRILVPGILAGMVAAIPMGLFAMIAAATYQHRGFYTPMYHIASLLTDEPILLSLKEAARGDLFFLDTQTVFFGVATHLAVSAFFGAIFALVAWIAGSRMRIVLAGLAYGLLIMVFMGFVLLPVVAAVLGGGELVSSMPSVAGWWTFTFQHIIFGLVLGLWPWLGPRDVPSRFTAWAERRRR